MKQDVLLFFSNINEVTICLFEIGLNLKALIYDNKLLVKTFFHLKELVITMMLHILYLLLHLLYSICVNKVYICNSL